MHQTTKYIGQRYKRGNAKRTCELSDCFHRMRNSCTGCIGLASLHKWSSRVPSCELSCLLHWQVQNCTGCNKSPLSCDFSCVSSFSQLRCTSNCRECIRIFSPHYHCHCTSRCELSCEQSFSLFRYTNNCKGCIRIFSQ